ncbi:unnamed protein product [Rangifer tarandus platyrhynchus]|uniref:Uncharacterized protein n=2 Tax=Rangifer tarandus platyrhynchus TaxID=3082113 RepID=A0ACB0F3R5_RANTA|nr:unnamed protein product [Rangifer tarandus platyrhynchus]CAI9707660.1 unnamed protein product [Rangifer tarandus platyrhynchus]
MKKRNWGKRACNRIEKAIPLTQQKVQTNSVDGGEGPQSPRFESRGRSKARTAVRARGRVGWLRDCLSSRCVSMKPTASAAAQAAPLAAVGSASPASSPSEPR